MSASDHKRLKVAPMSDAMLDAALRYAALGWRVFPAKSDGSKRSEKSARFSGGHPWGATTDPDEICADFARWPNANLGVVTGSGSGIIVLDVDTPKGHNVDGIASLRALEAQHGALPETLTATSPTGSVHCYFRCPEVPVKNSASRVGPGIDMRGEGGMVLAPPSVRPGVGQYRWLNQSAVASAPAWLIALASAGDPKRSHVASDQFEADLDLIAAALAVLPNDDEDWETWNVVGMAIFRASGGAGFAVFDGWSRKSAKYDARATAEKWAQYFRCPPTRIGAGSIFHWANKLSPGWDDEYWRKIELAVTTPNDPATVQMHIAWLKENVWK